MVTTTFKLLPSVSGHPASVPPEHAISTIERAITGNTFQIDNDKPDFSVECESSEYDGGISIKKCNIHTEIAQNDFVNMAANWDFWGLRIVYSSGGSISKNKFTNNTTALVLGNSNQISIEDNSISVTSLVQTERPQFFIGFNRSLSTPSKLVGTSKLIPSIFSVSTEASSPFCIAEIIFLVTGISNLLPVP